MKKMHYLSIFPALVLILLQLPIAHAAPGVRSAAASMPVTHTIGLVLAAPVHVCVGATITLVDTAAGGHWSSRNAAIATVDTAGIAVGVAAGIDTVLYVVGTDTTITVVTIDAPPHAAPISGTPTVCLGSLTMLSDSVAGGTWECANSNAVVTGTGTVAGISNGVDTVLYIVTNICGADTARLSIMVATPPTVGSIAGLPAICIGAHDSLTDSIAGGRWHSLNPFVATIDSFSGVATGHAGGVDTIQYRHDNSCGTATATFTLNVVAPPLPGFIAGADTACVGASITLTDAAGMGLWTNHSPTRGAIDSFTGIYGALLQGNDTIYYIIANMCGTATALHAIYNDSMKTSGSITGMDTLCAGSTTALTASVGGGIWNSSATMVASVDFTGNVSALGAGTCQISYLLGSACHSVSLFPLTVLPLPDAGIIDGPTGLCLPVNDTALLTSSSPGGIWSSSNPGVATIDSVGIIVASSYGSTTFGYTIQNACGISVDSFVFAVDIPVTAILGPATICQGVTTPNIFLGAPAGGNWNSSNFLVAAVVGVGGQGIVVGTAVGTAVISYSLTNTCGTTTTTEVVDVINCDTSKAAVGSAVFATIPKLVLFPNPAQYGRLFASYSAPGAVDATCTIRNTAGVTVWSGTLPTNMPIELHLDLPSGIYFVEAEAGGYRERAKLDIER